MGVKAVIFDRDHTLLHFDQAAIARIEGRISAIAPHVPRRAAAEHWARWGGPWPATRDAEARFWASFWRSFGEAYALTRRQVEQLDQLGDFYHTCFVAYPDAIPCLRALRARGLRMAVLTNFELPSVDRTLGSAGIEPAWFDALLSSAETGLYKPAAAAFGAIVDALALAPADCAFVDDLEENVAAARALGMRSFQIDRSAGTITRGELITSLAHLPSLITATS